MIYTSRRLVIFAKTYPELSTRHTETVCTGALDAETGAPVRLYPVPLRYLEDNADYNLYDVVDVPVRKSNSDPRPESYRVDARGIARLGHLEVDDFWRERRALVFQDPRWHFPTLTELRAANEATELSLGIVRPGQIDEVELWEKPERDRAAHLERSAELKAAKESDLFDPSYKDLEYLPYQVRLRWRCETRCVTCSKRPHRMQVLDWGLLELGRRKGWDKAISRMETIANLRVHDFRLFLGTFRLHPRNFGIIGMWYPKIPDQPALF
jgi:hypothetical protein